MSGAVRVLVADRAPTRLGVCLALAGHAEICAEAETCALAISAARSARPDVCLIGLSMPGGGLHAVREISRSAPETAVVVLSDRYDGNELLRVVRAGAVGYAPAGFDAQHLRRVITSVIAGEVVVPRSMVRELVNELRELERAAQDGLTVREAEILGMLRAGQPTTAIAMQLAISPITVRRHISKLVRKAGVRNRDQLIVRGGGLAAERTALR
ncbi:MAG: LuxR C-terminal-related transcriptional regulator [Solirubrobacteraceae bacterium]